MKFIAAFWRIMLEGLAVVLPVAVTVYLTWWLLTASETALLELLRNLFPGPGDPPYYFPGMGILAALALIFIIGLLAQAYLFKALVKLMDYVLARIPLLRSIYGGLKDVADMLANQDQKKKLNSVVIVTLNEDTRLLGMITRDDLSDLPEGMDDRKGDGVAVYLPMSYQVGGFTLFLPRSKVQPIDIPVDEALRFALTAGMSAQGEPAESPKVSSTSTQLRLKEHLRQSGRARAESSSHDRAEQQER